MTTYKCKQCKQTWTQGPTRDYSENRTCSLCLQPEVNPDNPMTKSLHDQWHMLMALAIHKLKLPEFTVTMEDVEDFNKHRANSAVLAHEKKDGLHIMLVTMEQAEALAKGEPNG